MIANTASLEVFLLRTLGASGVLGVLGVPEAMGMTPGVCGGTVFPAGWTGTAEWAGRVAAPILGVAVA